MQVNPKLLKQKFEKSMPKYNDNAIVQKEMAQLLMNLILENTTNEFNNILELGSGTGIFTHILTQNLNYKQLTCNDIVEKSKIYLKNLNINCEFILGNSSKIKPNGNFDLIASNAMFQWLSNLPEILEHYHRILNKNGILAFSTFTQGNYKEIKDAQSISLDYLSITDLQEIVNKKFKILACKNFEKTLIFNSPLELLAHIKNTGVNSLTSKKMSFIEIKEFCVIR